MLPKRKEGNPHPTGGKPDKLMRDALMVALKREAINADGKKTTKLYVIADKLADLACDGDVPSIKEIFDRVDGRSKESVEINHAGAIALESPALSFINEIVGRAIRAAEDRSLQNVLQDRPVLPAPVRVQQS